MKQIGLAAATGMMAVILLASVLHPADAQAARAALVIGNGAYQYITKLDNPVNDATAMAATLTRLGFQVATVTDASQQEIEEALAQFTRRVQQSELALVYYAGHGVQVDGVNYLVPVDANIKRQSEVKYKAVDAGLILDALIEAGSRVNIIILDACRDNPFRNLRGLRIGLAPLAAPKDVQTYIAYATAPNDYAADGVGDHSPFTAALLKTLPTPGLTIEQVFKRVRNLVREATADQKTPQIPWETSSLMGEFYFAAGAEPTAKPTIPPQPTPTPTPAPQPTAAQKPRQGEIWREPQTGMEFIRIEGSCFDMGSPPNEAGRSDDEGPVHRVCVDGFWMGKTEVTNAQYRVWKSDYTSQEYKGYSLNGDDQPAVYVSWEDAKQFAEWLTKQGKYTFRLPTEAEWEYAARAGTKTSRYWGENPNDACSYANVEDQTADQQFQWSGGHKCDDGSAVTAPVGSFKPNAFGLYDMLGNVWEWCEDIYVADAYKNSSSKNPRVGSGGSSRVLRGGCWSGVPLGVRSACRGRYAPSNRNVGIGFRLLRTK